MAERSAGSGGGLVARVRLPGRGPVEVLHGGGGLRMRVAPGAVPVACDGPFWRVRPAASGACGVVEPWIAPAGRVPPPPAAFPADALEDAVAFAREAFGDWRVEGGIAVEDADAPLPRPEPGLGLLEADGAAALAAALLPGAAPEAEAPAPRP